MHLLLDRLTVTSNAFPIISPHLYYPRHWDPIFLLCLLLYVSLHRRPSRPPRIRSEEQEQGIKICQKSLRKSKRTNLFTDRPAASVSASEEYIRLLYVFILSLHAFEGSSIPIRYANDSVNLIIGASTSSNRTHTQTHTHTLSPSHLISQSLSPCRSSLRFPLSLSLRPIPLSHYTQPSAYPTCAYVINLY
jgi:hypothetical protein